MSVLPPANPSKQALRKQALSLRQQLPIPRLSREICAGIASFSGFQAAQRVFFYYPIKHELDLRSLVHQFPQKQWFLPVVPPEQPMHFARCPDINQLQPGQFGIAEPHTTKNPKQLVFPPDLRAQDCMILPGLLFDRQGFRLGYGKGYFDRFLEAARQAEKTAVLLGAVPTDLLLDALPQDSWDLPVQWLITEREVIPARPALG